jgi:hypothetical protein
MHYRLLASAELELLAKFQLGVADRVAAGRCRIAQGAGQTMPTRHVRAVFTSEAK